MASKTPGLIELPGMKGEIRIPYDLTRGTVDIRTDGLPIGQCLQLLLVAAQAVTNQWQQLDAGIIRPKGQSDDGDKEASDPQNDNDD